MAFQIGTLPTFNTLWGYRQFIYIAIKNEFKIRFARSRMGAFWLILQPLFQVLIYALVLSRVISAKLPNTSTPYSYVVYLMAGSLLWSLFSDIVTRCVTLFIDNGNLIKKMPFPLITLPVIVLGTTLINNLILTLVTIGIFIFMGVFPGLQIFWLIFFMGAAAVFSLGVGLILGVINVFIRDLAHIVPIGLQLLFWATPIVYPMTVLSPNLKYLLSFNPLCYFVEVYQQLFLQGHISDLNQIFAITCLSASIFALGLFIFRRANAEMADVL